MSAFSLILTWLIWCIPGVLPAQKVSQPPIPQDRWAKEMDFEKRANITQPPVKILDALGIRPGMTVADIGAGRGRLTLPLARRVGASGKVYANDIRPDDLAFIQERCRREGLKNVEIVLGTETDARLPVKNLDVICMAWVYHVIPPANRVPMLQSLAPNLKPNGILAMAEPKPENIEVPANVVSAKRLAAEAEQAGLVLVQSVEDLLKEDTLFILKKKN
jgi:ubiquinone/menaquinone biosynthesis C-methylase UbiE